MRAAAVAMAMGDTDLLHEGSKVVPKSPQMPVPRKRCSGGRGTERGGRDSLAHFSFLVPLLLLDSPLLLSLHLLKHGVRQSDVPGIQDGHHTVQRSNLERNSRRPWPEMLTSKNSMLDH